MDCRALTDYLEQNKVYYEKNAKTSSLVSFRIGGTADIVIYPGTEGEFSEILRISNENGYKYAILGNGTNSYFCDGNYGGAVTDPVTGTAKTDTSPETADTAVMIFTAVIMMAAACGFVAKKQLAK